MLASAHIVALTGLAVIFSIVPAEARSPETSAVSPSASGLVSTSAPVQRTDCAIVVAAKVGKITRARSRAGRGDGEDGERDGSAQNGDSQNGNGPTRAESEAGNPAAADLAAKDPVAAPATAAATPAPVVTSPLPAKTAPAATTKLDCLAGCGDGNAVRAAARPPSQAAAATTTAPQAVENTGVVCIAGCGNDGPKATAQAVQTQSEVQATSDSKGSNRVTILRGNNRTKIYATGN